mmetsp:Transcript_25830/g.46685  ORF Transcript_25830/g.46685 Transcript_25830/m.46685 type:complete len:441 (-) Transcript_25830:380-1702(-)
MFSFFAIVMFSSLSSLSTAFLLLSLLAAPLLVLCFLLGIFLLAALPFHVLAMALLGTTTACLFFFASLFLFELLGLAFLAITVTHEGVEVFVDRVCLLETVKLALIDVDHEFTTMIERRNKDHVNWITLLLAIAGRRKWQSLEVGRRNIQILGVLAFLRVETDVELSLAFIPTLNGTGTIIEILLLHSLDNDSPVDISLANGSIRFLGGLHELLLRFFVGNQRLTVHVKVYATKLCCAKQDQQFKGGLLVGNLGFPKISPFLSLTFNVLENSFATKLLLLLFLYNGSLLLTLQLFLPTTLLGCSVFHVRFRRVRFKNILLIRSRRTLRVDPDLVFTGTLNSDTSFGIIPGFLFKTTSLLLCCFSFSLVALPLLVICDRDVFLLALASFFDNTDQAVGLFLGTTAILVLLCFGRTMRFGFFFTFSANEFVLLFLHLAFFLF